MKLNELLRSADIPILLESNLKDEIFQKDLDVKFSKKSHIDISGENNFDYLFIKIKEQASTNKGKAGEPYILVLEGFNKISSNAQVDLVEKLTELSKKENIKTVIPLDDSVCHAVKARTFSYSQEMAKSYTPEYKSSSFMGNAPKLTPKPVV